jgi:hypothetical protein
VGYCGLGARSEHCNGASLGPYHGPVVGLSPRRPGFDPRPVRVGFVADKVTPGQFFLRILRFPLSVSLPHCSMLICSSSVVVSVTDGCIKRAHLTSLID